MHIVTLSICAFCVGIFISSHHFFSWYVLFGFCGALGALSFFDTTQKYIHSAACIALCVTAGMLRFSVAEKMLGESPFLKAEKLFISGSVVTEPEHRDRDQRFVLALDGGSRLLVYTSLYAKISYGDCVTVSGTFELPESFITPSGRVFQYPEFLAKDGVMGIVRKATTAVVDDNCGNSVVTFLLAAKHTFVAQLHEVLPPDEAGLVSGFLIEGKQAVSSDLQDMFRRTGLSHTVALSGFNVSIILSQVVSLCLLWSRRAALFGGSLTIIIFVLMTGGQTTVIRASCMAFAALIGKCMLRRCDGGRSLLLSAFCMVLWNPYTLAFDFSFQLSFLATFALIYFSDFLYLFFIRILSPFARLWARESIMTTTAVYVFMTPFLLYTTGTLSVVALPANFLVVPTVPWAMLAGFLTGVFGLVSQPVSQLAAAPLHYLLTINLAVINWFSHLDFAYYETLRLPWWAAALFYVGVGYGMYRHEKHKSETHSTGAARTNMVA